MAPASRGLASLCFLLVILAALIQPVVCLQENLAGIVDWHKPLIGSPLLEPTPPRIFDTDEGTRILAITEKNVIACLDAKDGGIVWRHLLDDRDPVVSYHVRDNNVILLSGPSGTTARSLSLKTGSILWEKHLIPDPQSAHLTVPVYLGTDVGFQDDSVVVLSDGRRITRLDLQTGAVKWSLEAPGAGDTIIFKQLGVTGPAVHILAVSNSFSKTSLVAMSLSFETSQPLSDLNHIPSFISEPSQAMLTTESEEGISRVVWFEHGRIRSVPLDRTGKLGSTIKDNLPGKGHKYGSILDVGARDDGFVLGKKENGAVQILNMKEGGEIVSEFEASHASADKSESIYSYSKSKGGNPVFTRIYWSFNFNLAMIETATLSKPNEVITTGYTFPFDTQSHGVMKAATIAPTNSPTHKPEIMLTTSSDALVLKEEDKTNWIREESLANIVATRFVDLPEREVEQVGHVVMEENYIQRLTRHAIELQALPGYLLRFAKRFTGSSYTSTLALSPLNTTALHRDQFGLQKLVISATSNGKLVAIDSSNGDIVWSRNLGLFTPTGSNLQIKEMYLVREVGEGQNPTLAVLAQKASGESLITIGYHVDAFTGVVSGDADEATGVPKGKELFEGALKASFVTPFENCGTKNKVLGVVDSQDKIYIFPSCKKVAGNLEALSPGMFFTTRTSSLAGTTITGASLGARDGVTFSSNTIWSQTFSQGDVVHGIQPVSFQSVASFGRVLGDKSTLYKYLNPHLIVIASENPSKGSGSILVMDSISGKSIYSVSIHGREVSATMEENWLVYSWLEEGGWRIASVELFEDPPTPPNKKPVKPQGPGRSSFAPNHIKAISQTFISPTDVKTLYITSSKLGVTAKELVYTNGRGQVSTIPHRALDPRRPIGKPTSSDKEEMLVPYEPFIPPEPKRVISHKYQVLGVNSFSSSPALIESTSLLLAQGLDLFMTRGLNPSGTFDILSDNFNKAQLLLTLGALSIGIAIAKPAVEKKALKAKWY